MYRNAAAHAVATVVSAAVGFLLIPVLLLTAGRGEYGLWVLSQTFSASSGFLALFGLGLQTAVVRLVAGASGAPGGAAVRGIVRTALRACAWIGALGGLSLLAFGETIGPRVFHIPAGQVAAARVVFAITAAQGCVEYLSWAYLAALEGWQRYDLTRTLELLRLFVFAGLAVGMVRAGQGAVGLALATLAGVLARGAAAAMAVERRLSREAPTSHSANRVDLFHLARTFSSINLIGVIYNLIDRTVISTMVGVQWLADYDVIAKVNSLASIPANILPSVVPAAGAHLHARGEQEALRTLFLRSTRHSLYISLLVAVVLMLLAPQILGVWVGPEFVRLGPVLRLYLSQHLFQPMILVGYGLAVGFGAVAPLARLTGLSTGLNIVLSITFTRLMGFPGTLLGTVVSMAAILPLYLGHLRKVLDVSLGRFVREALVRPYVLTGICVGLVAPLVMRDAGAGLVGLAVKSAWIGGVFAGLVWIFGLDQDERRHVRGLLEKAGRHVRSAAGMR